jgi:hypothetical protein
MSHVTAVTLRTTLMTSHTRVGALLISCSENRITADQYTYRGLLFHMYRAGKIARDSKSHGRTRYPAQQERAGRS